MPQDLEAHGPLRPPAGHYSHAVRAGDFVFISGQLPTPATGAHDPSAPLEAQCDQALANLCLALRSADCGPQHIVRCTAYIVGVEGWPTFNMRFAAWIGDHRPARTIIPVPSLHYGYLVEVEAIAFRPEQS